MSIETSTLGQLLADIPRDTFYPSLIAVIIGCLLAAFFSFRFFKLSIVLSGAVVGYSFGSVNLGMLIGDRITAFNAPLVLGIICAVVFAILTPKFYKLCIYLLGGILGFVVGESLSIGVLSAFGYEIAGSLVGIVAGIALAIVGAKLLYRFFKPYLIVVSSFVGSVFAAIFTSYLLFGDNEIFIAIFALLGIALGVVSMRAQFKMNEDRDLDL